MNFLWFILLVAGAVASIMQKNQERQRRTAPHEDDEPAQDPRQEWERRIRRMLGETDSAPDGAERPVTPQPVQHTNGPARHTAADTQTSARRKAARHKQPEPVKTAPSNRKTQQQTASATRNSAPADKTCPDGAGSITDGFDLERAVVYSEILKPKFEEYEY